jgi:hypothetical protein
VEKFIIDHCDNFVIEDIIVKILEECFDIEKSEEIKSKFEKNEKEFLKFIQSEQERNKLKRIHTDLEKSKLNDNSLNKFPLKKIKINRQDKLLIKSSTESVIDNESINKSNHSISLDTQNNIVTINNNSFFINNLNNGFLKNKQEEFNFKNIKEKLMDRNLDPFKSSNNYFSENKIIDVKNENNNKIRRQNHIRDNFDTNFINNCNLSFENEKSNENTFQNSSMNHNNSGIEKDSNNLIQNNEVNYKNDNINSNLGLLRKENNTQNSLIIHSNNKSTNASNRSSSNYLSFRDLFNNDNRMYKISEKNNSINQIGFDKNNNLFNFDLSNSIVGNNYNKIINENNHKIDEITNKINRNHTDCNKLFEKKQDNLNAVKNKLRSGINANLNYNIANLQKLKREKSKKKNSKNKPELINKLFEKLTEKINKSEEINAIMNKFDTKKINLSEYTLELNKKNNYQNEIMKDNLRQKGVDEYFEKVSHDNPRELIRNDENVFPKNNLKYIINDKFYLKKFCNKSPEKLENPKYSKRKNPTDINNNHQAAKNSKENIKQESNKDKILIRKENYCEKKYDLLKLNNKNNRCVSEEPPKPLNIFELTYNNDDTINEKNCLKKSPILTYNIYDKLNSINHLNSVNIQMDNVIKNSQENNLSSEDEVLAYSTPTKIQMNKNFRKTSKERDSFHQKNNNSGLNLLNLFKQIKK